MAGSLVPTNTGAPPSSFWGGFAQSIGGTIARTVDQVAPVWTAKALGLQQRDQLARDGVVYVQTAPRIGESGSTVLGNGNNNTLLIVGAAVVLAVVLLK